MSFDRTGVVGAGTMGHGIAQVLAASGRRVRLVDVSPVALDKGIAAIVASLGKFVEKGKLSAEERDAVLGRIAAASDLDALADADIVVEAAVEDVAAKQDIFRRLGRVVSERGILASNTSSISITRLAGAVPHPERVIGMHFMNPVPIMKLVEVVRGVQTSDATVDSVNALAAALGKTPVVVRDYPGFVS
ncbi:MAG: 3-hydroxyacyl-CoA dehydrogenase family protein, partial [Candidatus Eiseniibacteriota bacterium]